MKSDEMKMNVRIGQRDNKRMNMWKALTENTTKSKYKIAQECFYLGLEFYYNVLQKNESEILGSVENPSKEEGNNNPSPSPAQSPPQNISVNTQPTEELTEKSRILEMIHSQPIPDPLNAEEIAKKRREKEERQLEALRQTNPGMAHMLEVGLDLGAELRKELKTRRKGNGD